MIILDSCVIRGMRLDSSNVEVLRAIAATKTERVGAPWMALEELAAQKALDYLQAHKEAARALRQLQNRSHKSEPKLDGPDAEGVREMWRRKYAGFLQVLPTSENALRVGVYREANVLPPATTKGDGEKKVKVGARDVAIWLTAVEYAREHPDETVYFVSSNHRDFTKGGAGYPSPMAEDIAGLGERFVHLTDLEELLETVAPGVAADAAAVRGLVELQTTFVADRCLHSWGSLERRSQFQVTTQDGEHAAAQGWLFGDKVTVKLVDVRDTEAYRLGDRAWYVATARWQFVGTAMMVASPMQTAACTWETRILAPLRSSDDHLPIIIKSHLPQAADGDSVEWPALPNYQEVAQRLIEAAQADGRNPTWVEVLLGAVLAFPALRANSGADLATYPALSQQQLDSFKRGIAPHTTESGDEEPDEE
ncbi:PIN domain-containing protein [Streptomyces sp. NPDC057235]|uniref:PIN domain-containing protein n=1 Tax=Streptomyces sp. NPDC057235 TaxID=3346058 RepID=UPI0036425DA4